MLTIVRKYWGIFLNKEGHERTLRARRNIITSFILKGFSIVVSFVIVPISINYLNPTKYGIWLTISSIIGWFGFFDIGLGNGLRNKLTKAFANNDLIQAKKYISTTYAILIAIIAVIYILFVIVNQFINWSLVLNIQKDMEKELSVLMLIVFTFFCIRFVLKLVGIVLTSDQRPAINNSFDFFSNLISLIAIIVITKISQGSLIYISIAYTASPVFVLIIASLYFYKNKYTEIKPSFKYIRIKYAKPLMSLGFKFLVLQLSVLIVFSTDNFLITQILGPIEVTPYNIAYKYFGFIPMVFSIILTPYWSAYTDAIIKNDIIWIRRSIKSIIIIWLVIVCVVIIMAFFSKQIYHLWIGDEVHIPILLSIFMAFYAILTTWSNIYVFFLNGCGKIKMQMYYSILSMIINIPLSIILADYFRLGSSGIIFGTCISLLFGSLIAPIQTYKLLNGTARGIWNK